MKETMFREEAASLGLTAAALARNGSVSGARAVAREAANFASAAMVLSGGRTVRFQIFGVRNGLRWGRGVEILDGLDR